MTDNEYVNNRTNVAFRCDNGHVWSEYVQRVLGWRGCPECIGDHRPAHWLSKEIVNSRLEPHGITLVSEYVDMNTMSVFRCAHDKEWNTRPGTVLGSPRCPCEGYQGRLFTKDIVNAKLAASGSDIRVIGEYKNNYTKTLFECVNDHHWEAVPSSALQGYGCPTCAKYGFDSSEPGWEYAFTRDGYLKFGITNDLIRRLNEHRKHGEITVVHERYHEVGQGAVDWERHIKRTHGGRYATKEQCPDGYTETLPLALLEEIRQPSPCLPSGCSRR
jgi:hypothetical protein